LPIATIYDSQTHANVALARDAYQTFLLAIALQTVY